MRIRRVLAGAALAFAGSAFMALPAAAAPNYPPGSEGLEVSETNVTPGEAITISGDGFRPGSHVSVSVSTSAQGFAGGAAVDPATVVAPAGGWIGAAPVVSRFALTVCTSGQTCEVTTDSNGAFSIQVLLTEPGTAVVTATGVSPSGTPVVQSSTITVAGPAAGGGPGAGPGGPGWPGHGGPPPHGKGWGLPNTGASITVPLIAGGVLVAVGIGVLAGTRRRKAGADNG